MLLFMDVDKFFKEKKEITLWFLKYLPVQFYFL